MYYYEITIRKTANPVWIVDYEDFFANFQMKYPYAIVEYSYEPQRGLHAHGLVVSPRRIYVNKFHPGKGWNLEFEFVRNRWAWDKYKRKHAHLQPDLINREYDLYSEFLEYQSKDLSLSTQLSDDEFSLQTHLESEFDIRKLKSGLYIVPDSGERSESA